MDDYDVFLNHRGPDMKRGFVAHLHEALRSVGLNVFLDKKSLGHGDPAFESINEALEKARVHVAVVSKGYAESKYCLSELVAIMRSGKPVLPVFYDVEPAHSRRVENGPFATAFENHKSRETPEQVEEWADALRKLAAVTGFYFWSSDYNGDEAELKQQLVAAIRRVAPRNVALLQVERHVVGLQEQVSVCVDNLERMSGATGVLGIVGMGGIGKTCLAKQIFNHLVAQKKFQAMSFLKVDRRSPSGNEVGSNLLRSLQEQLLQDLLLVRDSTQTSYDYWFPKLSSQGPVLVVMDDIHDKKQFDKLIPDTSLLAPGSCIIVTSRDRDLLKRIARGTKFYLHEVTKLGCNDSERLFNWHAFGVENAQENFQSLTQDVSKACGGLPLALKVVGRSLFDKLSNEDRSLWLEAVDALQGDPDVMDVLKWSYNKLLEPEKLMFLDIANVFHGWYKEDVLVIWESCKRCSSCCGCKTPLTSLRHLIDKSLVELVYDHTKGRLAMHGLLQELGKAIGKIDGSHLWEDAAEKALLGNIQDTNEVRSLNLTQCRKRKFEAEKFTKLTKLHHLVLNGCEVSGAFKSNLQELRYLQWTNMPSTQLPPMLNLFNLTVLDFSESTKLASLWTESSPTLQACPNLLRLNLTRCTSITMLPDSIGHLSRLRQLNLDQCTNLQKLPSSIGQLTALQTFSLGYCRSLKALPDSITALSGLRLLFIWGCSSISKLPTEIGRMTGLSYLALDLSTEWQALGIGHFNEVRTLATTHCTEESITALDRSGTLKNLEQLSRIIISWCPFMTRIPETIGLLSNLEQLQLHSCVRLQELPNSIGQLKALKCLYLSGCNSLVTLPDSLTALTSLQNLWIAECTSITKLPPSMGQLSSLRTLKMQGCNGLQSLPGSLRQLNALGYLSIVDCGSLEGLGVLRVLQGHRVWGCTSIAKLPGSCLVVTVNDPKSVASFWYLPPGSRAGLWDSRDVMELRRLETNDCGFLRQVQDTLSGRIILQRVHKWPCTQDSEYSTDTSTSEDDEDDGGDTSDEDCSGREDVDEEDCDEEENRESAEDGFGKSDGDSEQKETPGQPSITGCK